MAHRAQDKRSLWWSDEPVGSVQYGEIPVLCPASYNMRQRAWPAKQKMGEPDGGTGGRIDLLILRPTTRPCADIERYATGPATAWGKQIKWTRHIEFLKWIETFK